MRPGQPLRGEILLEGNVPPDAIVTPTRQALKYAGRTVMILGIAITIWDLGKAAGQSVEQGSIRPIAREAVRQTTTWGAAVAMGVDGAMIGAAFGPVGAVVGGIIGSAVGAIAGSVVGDWLADLF